MSLIQWARMVYIDHDGYHEIELTIDAIPAATARGWMRYDTYVEQVNAVYSRDTSASHEKRKRTV